MGAEEVWAAQRDNGVERFSLWADGDLASEHVGCFVRLEAAELHALAIAANRVADALERGQNADG